MEELNFNNDDEYFDLETLITEGTEAKIPIIIEFPNGKKAKALIKPILAEDLKTVNFDFDKPFEVIAEILKMCLFNSKGEQLSEKFINGLPAGLPMEIGMEIFKISGIEINPNKSGQLKEDLQSFLKS